MKQKISLQELRYNLKASGIEVTQSYCHKDYMYTSFTMPYTLKNKLDRIQRKYKISRSRIIQLFLENVDETDFFESVKNLK